VEPVFAVGVALAGVAPFFFLAGVALAGAVVVGRAVVGRAVVAVVVAVVVGRAVVGVAAGEVAVANVGGVAIAVAMEMMEPTGFTKMEGEELRDRFDSGVWLGLLGMKGVLGTRGSEIEGGFG